MALGAGLLHMGAGLWGQGACLRHQGRDYNLGGGATARVR